MERDSDDNLSIVILYLKRLVTSTVLEKEGLLTPLAGVLRRLFK
jgi:hypothetical protein